MKFYSYDAYVYSFIGKKVSMYLFRMNTGGCI